MIEILKVMSKQKREVSEHNGVDDKRPVRKRQKKVISGPLRDKERTIKNLKEAVGKVILKKGYKGLNGSNVANEAGVNAKLISAYFNGLNNLCEAYIMEQDFWNMADKKMIKQMLLKPESIGRREITALLHGQLERMIVDRELQKIIQWEIAEENETLRKLADKREEIGEQLFGIIEPEFKDSGVDIRPKLALQIAGIYYLVLHATTNGSLFCGLDLNTAADLNRLRKALEDNVNALYEEAKVNK